MGEGSIDLWDMVLYNGRVILIVLIGFIVVNGDHQAYKRRVAKDWLTFKSHNLSGKKVTCHNKMTSTNCFPFLVITLPGKM